MKVASRILPCAAMILLATTATFAQGTHVSPSPTSGAMLTITNSGGAAIVQIYDSQIHSGTVAAPCAQDALFPTDAYVLQGGSATGCDNGDSYEVTDNNPNLVHQMPGSKDIGGFHIETHYICSSGLFDEVGNCELGEVPLCNTSRTICANPDTGFITITNTGNADFTGSFTLQGNAQAVEPNPSWCPANGVALDSWTGTLAAASDEVIPEGAVRSVTLALGAQGEPGSADSSNCGGFNFDQSQTINGDHPFATFLFGPDTFTVTPSNIISGDTLTFRPVPIPQGNFNAPLAGNVLTNSPVGNGQGCVTYASFSAKNGGNSVCPEFQTKCLNPAAKNAPACDDAETFFWRGEIDFTVDKFSFPNGVGPGGVHFLGQKAADCTQNAFSEDTIISYQGAAPGTDPPLKPGGSGLNCFVATYVPGAPAVPNGVVASAFFGFEFPFSDNKLNHICPGCIAPLNFDQSDGAGGPPLKNLHWCPNPAGSPSPTGCGTLAHQIPQPWVTFSQIPFACPDGTNNNFVAGPIFPFFGLLNLGVSQDEVNQPPMAEYTFPWFVPFFERGCATVQLQYSSGLVVAPAQFEIKPFNF